MPLGVPAPPGARTGLVRGGEGHGGLKPAGPGGQGLCVCTAGGVSLGWKREECHSPRSHRDVVGRRAFSGHRTRVGSLWPRTGRPAGPPSPAASPPWPSRGRAVAEAEAWPGCSLSQRQQALPEPKLAPSGVKGGRVRWATCPPGPRGPHTGEWAHAAEAAAARCAHLMPRGARRPGTGRGPSSLCSLAASGPVSLAARCYSAGERS